MAASVNALHAAWNNNPPDGAVGVVGIGDDSVEVEWFDSLNLWLSQPEPHVEWRGDWRQNASGAVIPNSMAYLYKPSGNNGQYGQGSYGWSARPIYKPSAKYAAGLKLFEMAGGYYWAFDLDSVVGIWTVIYAMNHGAQISGTIEPQDFESLEWPAVLGIRKWDDTGWVQSPLTPPANTDLWATHLYSMYQGAPPTATLETIVGAEFERRWGGAPT